MARADLNRPAAAGIAGALGAALLFAALPAPAALVAVPGDAALSAEGYSLSLTVADVDGDGDPDLIEINDALLSRRGEGSRLLLNHDGVLAERAVPALAVARAGRNVAPADVDGDGDIDLYLVDAAGPNVLLLGDGRGGFVEAPAGPLADAGVGRHAAFGDYDADGDVDLYLVNALSPNRLFRNDGEAGFVDATPEELALATNGYSAAWVDADVDGRLDLFVVSHGAPARLFRNTPQGFAEMAPGVFDVAAGQASAWGDHDRDGDPDVYVVSADGLNRLFRNDGAGVFTDVTPAAATGFAGSRSATWVDVDLDGALDLYVSAVGTGHRLFRNDGRGTLRAARDLAPRAGAGAGGVFADFDGDGDPDLVTANLGVKEYFRNDAAGGRNWLSVELVGAKGNRSAIGARIAVTADGRTEVRSLGTGGAWSHDGARTLFGLGSADRVERVEVRWPSGVSTTLTGLPINRRIVVEEGRTVPNAELATQEAAPPADVRLGAADPNPFSAATRLHFEIPSRAVVRLSIFDVSGRLVRRLVPDVAFDAGRHIVDWDGRDDDGRLAASGVYQSRLEVEGRTESGRIVVTR